MCIPKTQHFSLTPWKVTRHNTVRRMRGRRRIFCGRTLVPESRMNKDWCVASLQDKSSSSKRGAGEPPRLGLRYTMIILFPISTYTLLALRLANLVRDCTPQRYTAATSTVRHSGSCLDGSCRSTEEVLPTLREALKRDTVLATDGSAVLKRQPKCCRNPMCKESVT